MEVESERCTEVFADFGARGRPAEEVAEAAMKEARAYLDVVLAPLCLVHTSIPLVERALAVRLRWGFSWFDALVVAGAMEAGCSVLYSEDLQHGQDLDGLRVVDPFRPGV